MLSRATRLCLYLLHAGLAWALAGCSTPATAPAWPPLPPQVAAVLPTPVLLLGEQHDADSHARLHEDTVRALAARDALAALVLEMAPQGASTTDLPAWIDEATVRTALRWDDAAWPWTRYGPAVMAAVRAGVVVRGANLLPAQMRQALGDDSLDRLLPPAALAQQREAIREGHCGLLPEAQIAPMTRVQIARDRAMARTLADSVQAGRTAVLLAGHGHVDPQVGVPQHLPAAVAARPVTWPAAPALKDYCEALRQQLAPRS